MTVKWEATVGAGRYQVQRQQGMRWRGVGSTVSLRLQDPIPPSQSWSNSFCYRVRVLSPAGVVGPWSPQECTA